MRCFCMQRMFSRTYPSNEAFSFRYKAYKCAFNLTGKNSFIVCVVFISKFQLHRRIQYAWDQSRLNHTLRTTKNKSPPTAHVSTININSLHLLLLLHFWIVFEYVFGGMNEQSTNKSYVPIKILSFKHLIIARRVWFEHPPHRCRSHLFSVANARLKTKILQRRGRWREVGGWFEPIENLNLCIKHKMTIIAAISMQSTIFPTTFERTFMATFWNPFIFQCVRLLAFMRYIWQMKLLLLGCFLLLHNPFLHK